MNAIHQPLTVAQIAKRAQLALNRCSEGVRALRDRGHLVCLNSDAVCSRVHWLTASGGVAQLLSCQQRVVEPPRHFVPRADWALYGRVCSSHRRTVIKTLNEPMQPAAIKRRAFSNNPRIRMSANNTRDVIYFLRAHRVVEPVRVHRKTHVSYRLTEIGLLFRRLLFRAEEPT